jgi:hypothetical protein
MNMAVFPYDTNVASNLHGNRVDLNRLEVFKESWRPEGKLIY